MLTLLIRLPGSCLLLLPIIIGMFFPGSARAGSLRVPSEVANIQLAINSTAPRDTVFVEAGTYTGAGNKNLNFGGRDIVVWGVDGADATIIDCEGSATDNARGFIFENGEPHTAVVSGFTIRNGYRSGTDWPGDYGGGILIRNPGTRPTIKNCVFEDNYVLARGGGVAAGDESEPSVVFCRFLNNTAFSGGGGAYASSDVTFVECEFTGNETSGGTGGGFKSDGSSAPRIRDCIFRDNRARAGGGLSSSEAVATVAQCIFVENEAFLFRGGGVYAGSAADIFLSNCVFIGNDGPGDGGAAACVGATMTLDGCTLYGNVSPFGAGLYVHETGSLQVENTIIAFGSEGAAVACDGAATVNLICCDLFGNQGGDWVGCIAGQAGANGNISADPLFCNVGEENLYLAETSPCAPEHAGACGLIGRYGVDCTSAVEEATWGAVKALYRR